MGEEEEETDVTCPRLYRRKKRRRRTEMEKGEREKTCHQKQNVDVQCKHVTNHSHRKVCMNASPYGLTAYLPNGVARATVGRHHAKDQKQTLTFLGIFHQHQYLYTICITYMFVM